MRCMNVRSIGKQAFDAIYESNLDYVYRTACYYTQNHYQAEEITQCVFIKLYDNIDNVNMQSVNSWPLITTKHMALNYKRDYARETLIDELLYDNEVGDSLETCYMTEFDRTKRKELADEIYLRLFEENKRWYDAIMAVYLLEKPQKEVAREMGISLEVLHSMLYRAKKWIRKNYEKRYRYLDEA